MQILEKVELFQGNAFGVLFPPLPSSPCGCQLVLRFSADATQGNKTSVLVWGRDWIGKHVNILLKSWLDSKSHHCCSPYL